MTAPPRDDSSGASAREQLNSFLSHLRLPPATLSEGVARLEFVVEEVHLRHGGIIAPRRQGKNNYYSLTETGADLAKVVKNLIS